MLIFILKIRFNFSTEQVTLMRRPTVLSHPLQLVFLIRPPIYLSLEEVTVCDGLKVLVEVNNCSVLIDGNPQGILG